MEMRRSRRRRHFKKSTSCSSLRLRTLVCKMLEEGSNEEDALESLDASPQRVGRSFSAATASANTDSHSLIAACCLEWLVHVFLLIFTNQNEF